MAVKVRSGSIILERKRVIFSRLLISSSFSELERWNVLDFFRESLGPVHCHCLAHYLSYILIVVRGLGWGPVVVELDWGLWVVGGLLPCPMPGLPHSAPHQKPEIP